MRWGRFRAGNPADCERSGPEPVVRHEDPDGDGRTPQGVETRTLVKVGDRRPEFRG